VRPPETRHPARVDARNRAGIDLQQRDSSKNSPHRKIDRIIELLAETMARANLAERFPLCLAIDPAIRAALGGVVLLSAAHLIGRAFE
jgi:hypothetical protein